MYWKVLEPIIDARLTRSGRAMVKRSDEAWKIMREKPGSAGMAMRNAWGRV